MTNKLKIRQCSLLSFISVLDFYPLDGRHVQENLNRHFVYHKDLP